MERKPEKGPEQGAEEATHERHKQFPQDSWTEIDAEGSDSEMAQGRQASEPFYTPLVNEAAERRLKKERQQATAGRQPEAGSKAQATRRKAPGTGQEKPSDPGEKAA